MWNYSTLSSKRFYHKCLAGPWIRLCIVVYFVDFEHIWISREGNNNIEVYSEPCQTSNMILFTIIFAKSSISDVRQGSLKYPSLTCQTWLSCHKVYPHSRHFLHLPPQTWRHGSVREKTWVTMLNLFKHFFWVES